MAFQGWKQNLLSMDKQQWVEFLTAAGIEKEEVRENYATELSNSEMTSAMLVELNKFGDELKEFHINIRGHVIKIIDHAKKTEEEKSKDDEGVRSSVIVEKLADEKLDYMFDILSRLYTMSKKILERLEQAEALF